MSESATAVSSKLPHFMATRPAASRVHGQRLTIWIDSFYVSPPTETSLTFCAGMPFEQGFLGRLTPAGVRTTIPEIQEGPLKSFPDNDLARLTVSPKPAIRHCWHSFSARDAYI